MQMNQARIWQHPEWPAFRWNQAALATLLADARLAQGKVLGAALLLDAHLMLEAVASILVEDGVTTSAIEGDRLDVAAVRSSVARHLGLSTVGLPVPSRAVDGLVEVLLDATRHFEATPRAGLDRELNCFLDWFNEPAADLDGLIRAGLAHLWFITLHPFEDGNGRLARAITDMAVAQDEAQPMRFFSLSAQILREQASYYEVLERTQRGDIDVTGWLAWFLRQVSAAATAAEKTVANTLAKARFWLRHRSTHLNERQRKALDRLLDAGSGGFEGGRSSAYEVAW